MEEQEVKEGRVRWAFNFEDWKPTQEEWEKALSLLEPEEKARILRFKRPTQAGYIVGKENPDSKSSLVGRLLIQKMVHSQLGIPYSEIKLTRTKENKPYLINPVTQFPNFNFNVSHAGKFVAAGCEPRWIVGVDVMDIALRRQEPVQNFFTTMRNCFTPKEWRTIEGGKDDQEKLRQFFNHWTLKEAYIKSVGIGLGFELQRAEFTLPSPELSATIAIDGKPREDWQFELHPIDNNKHVIAVAYGPPSQTTPNYASVLKPDSTTDVPNVPRIEFTILTFEDIRQGFF